MINEVKFSGIMNKPPKETMTPAGARKILFFLDQKGSNGKSMTVPVTLWNEKADDWAAQRHEAGDEVFVSGRLTISNYKDKQTDQWKPWAEVSADHFECIPMPPNAFPTPSQRAVIPPPPRVAQICTPEFTEEDIPF